MIIRSVSGRNSVREALRILEDRGLIYVKTGSGVFINNPYGENNSLTIQLTNCTLAEMEELQNALDHEAVKNAMERGTIQEKDQLVATATEMVRLASDNLYSHVLDRSFHDSLYKIGRNNAIEQMINKIRSYRFIQQEDSQNGNDSIWLATIPQHLALAQANGFGRLVAHAPYTINPCSKTERTREFARMTLADDLKRMEYLPGNYYNFHPGSHPEQGENAIGRLVCYLDRLPLEGDAKQAVHFLAEKLGTDPYGERLLGHRLEDALSGPMSCNWGLIEGDAQHLWVKLNYRYPVTMERADCQPAVQAAFEAAGWALDGQVHKEKLYYPAETPLVSALLEVYRDATGDNAPPKCIGGGTYAKMLPNVVAFGPLFAGDPVTEHQPDECIDLERLVQNAQIIANAIVKLANLPLE